MQALRYAVAKVALLCISSLSVKDVTLETRLRVMLRHSLAVCHTGMIKTLVLVCAKRGTLTAMLMLWAYCGECCIFKFEVLICEQ